MLLLLLGWAGSGGPVVVHGPTRIGGHPDSFLSRDPAVFGREVHRLKERTDAELTSGYAPDRLPDRLQDIF